MAKYLQTFCCVFILFFRSMKIFNRRFHDYEFLFQQQIDCCVSRYKMRASSCLNNKEKTQFGAKCLRVTDAFRSYLRPYRQTLSLYADNSNRLFRLQTWESGSGYSVSLQQFQQMENIRNNNTKIVQVDSAT